MQYIIGFALLAIWLIFIYYGPTSIVTAVVFGIAGLIVGRLCGDAGKYLAERFFN